MNLIILGDPVSQLRPRATRTKKGVRLYDPEKTEKYKRAVRLSARAQWQGQPLREPLSVDIKFFKALQKTCTKKEKKLKLEGKIRPTVKPDIDNYTKAILDSLNDIVWHDDSFVVDLKASKFYSEKPRVEINIRRVNDGVH